MARAYGKLKKSRWREDAWLKLPADAQWLYVYLLSQPTTDTAGVFPIRLTKWPKGAADMSRERVLAAAKTLNDSGWILVDHDFEEGLICNYIRDDEAGDNIFKGALNRAVLAQSSLIRRCLFEEIQSLDRTFNDREQQLIQELAESLGDLPSGGPW